MTAPTMRLDEIWKSYASRVPGLLERRPDFRVDPDLPSTFYTKHIAGSAAVEQALARLVIDAELSALIEADTPDALHLACELIRLGSPVDAEMSDFSHDLYLRMHSDIARAKMDPLLHYLHHGAAEGRRILADLRKSQYPGKLPYSPDRPTCLICVHEMSRTGAPIVGRDLAREAAQTHNVIVSALRDGPLLEEFRATSCQVLITSDPFNDFAAYSGDVLQKIDFAILNSAVSRDYIPFLVAKDIPFAGYIHEYAEYLYPPFFFNLFLMFADLVVFSSDHVRDSWKGRMADFNFDCARDSTIIPQRPLFLGSVTAERKATARANLSQMIGRDLSTARIVCGAGQSQWRKGTDMFAMAAQICQSRAEDTVFIWIGDGIVADEMGFGAYMAYHLRQIGMGEEGSNLFFLPAGPAYFDVLAASDAMFMSSRLDPLPNVVFDALAYGCHIVQFEGASGFGDDIYRQSERFSTVPYGDPEAAATALLALAPKPTAETSAEKPDFNVFEMIRSRLRARLKAQTYFVRGVSQIDTPVMFTAEPKGSALRQLEFEKMARYGRRYVWRDLEEVEQELASSDNWIHRHLRLAPYETTESAALPSFSLHIHAFYTDDLADDVQRYALYRHASRIVVTTDTAEKEAEIKQIMQAEGLHPEVVRVSNTGRDILPFLQLFDAGGAAGQDEIWCHLHQKKSFSTTESGDVWRRFLMRILLGNETEFSVAPRLMADPRIGLVAPFDPYFLGWNDSRKLLPKFAGRLPGPLPENPLLFPVGNMFWVRRSVVLAMKALFGQDYPWPNEPIANDGTEFHLIERLWPAMASQQELDSVFLHKLDEKRV